MYTLETPKNIKNQEFKKTLDLMEDMINLVSNVRSGCVLSSGENTSYEHSKSSLKHSIQVLRIENGEEVECTEDEWWLKRYGVDRQKQREEASKQKVKDLEEQLAKARREENAEL